MEKLNINITKTTIKFRVHLKTGNWLKDFSIVHLKSGKGLTGSLRLRLKTGNVLIDSFYACLKQKTV